MRLYFVLPCTLSLIEFVRLYFVLQPQIFQLVPRQPLTQVVLLFFIAQLPVIQPLFSLPLFHSPSLSSSSRIFRSTSPHRSQFGFARAAFPFYSYLQLFGSFFKLSIVIQCSLVYKLTFFLLKKCYFFSKKKNL